VTIDMIALCLVGYASYQAARRGLWTS
jgi:hypothetical protein